MVHECIDRQLPVCMNTVCTGCVLCVCFHMNTCVHVCSESRAECRSATRQLSPGAGSQAVPLMPLLGSDGLGGLQPKLCLEEPSSRTHTPQRDMEQPGLAWPGQRGFKPNPAATPWLFLWKCQAPAVWAQGGDQSSGCGGCALGTVGALLGRRCPAPRGHRTAHLLLCWCLCPVQPSSLPDPPGQPQSSGDREPQQWGEEQLPGKSLTLLWERELCLPVPWAGAVGADTSTAHSSPGRPGLPVFFPDTWASFGLSFQSD